MDLTKIIFCYYSAKYANLLIFPIDIRDHYGKNLLYVQFNYNANSADVIQTTQFCRHWSWNHIPVTVCKLSQTYKVSVADSELNCLLGHTAHFHQHLCT